MDFLKKAMSNPSVSNALGGKTGGSSSSHQQPGQPSQPKKEGEDIQVLLSLQRLGLTTAGRSPRQRSAKQNDVPLCCTDPVLRSH
jgi:hypothetical protein